MMKKRRYRDFAARSSTTQGNPRRPYPGWVSSSDRTENLTRREYYDDDGDADRQPPQTHLNGGLRQCESPSMKFQWNNLLAQNPNPGSNPRSFPGRTRSEFDYSHRLDYDMGNQYGHGGLPKSKLGLQANVEDRRHVGDVFDRTRPVAELPIGRGGGQSPPPNELAALSDGFRNEYDRTSAMAAGFLEAIGHGGGCARGHTTPRLHQLVGYGGSSIGDEFNRSRETDHGGYSQGQTARHNEFADNAASSEALNEGFRGGGRAMAEGSVGHCGYSQCQTVRHSEFVDNVASSEALSEGFRGITREIMSHGGYFQGQATRRNEPVANVLSEDSNEGFLSRSRAMAEGSVGGAGYTQGQTLTHNILPVSFNETLHTRSRAVAEGAVGHAGYSQGHAPTHSIGSSPIDLNGGFRASDELSSPIGGYSHGRSRAMGEAPVSHAAYSQGLAPRPNNGGLPIALNEGSCGSAEFNNSRELTGGYSHGQTPRKNELVHPREPQQSPKEAIGRDYMVPRMKRNENGGDMDALNLLDMFLKKMSGAKEDPRSPTHLRPSVTESVMQRVGDSKGSVGASTHESCQLDQYHNYMEPTNMFPNHPSSRESSIPCQDEVLGSSNPRTEVSLKNEYRGFRLGVHVGHEREVEPSSYAGNQQTLDLPDEDQGLLEAYGGCQQRLAAAKALASMTPIGRWALRKEAMKEHQSGNHSKSKFFPDLKPSRNVLESYEVGTPLTTSEDMQQQYADDDNQQYAATCGEYQWIMEKNVIFGDGQWNIDQCVTHGMDQRNVAEGSIEQDVTCGMDRRGIAQGVTSGESQCNIHQGVVFGGNRWNNDQGVRTCGEQPWRMNYGEDHWDAEHINNLNSDSLLLNSELPASMQEHYGEQRKSPRLHVKDRLGPSKTGSIKTRLGPPIKSPGSVKMRLGPFKNDPNVHILGCKAREQYISRIRKTDDFSGGIHSQGDGFLKAKTNATTGSIHPQGSGFPQVKMNGSSGSIHPHGSGLSVKTDGTESIHLQGNANENVKKGDINENICPQSGNESICPQGGSLTKADVRPAKKEPPEDSKEFKQLVDDAFIKFINILIENPMERRKVIEGKGGKCRVCASSKEFVETAALAMHAFMSPKVGFRAEHLGFHKALCVLLGWDSASVSNGRWVQRKLSDAETLALKEDLIIWPPVVVIHSNPIANKNTEDGKLTVDVEGLQTILTGMGVVGRKTNICCGKPADGSVMVLKFQPTFSGLQEAERLDRLFADNKHGKAEWRHISSVGLSNISSGKQNLEANGAICLHGYLGNADDWNELDLKTKKHYGVKSKEQIKAIANASLCCQ